VALRGAGRIATNVPNASHSRLVCTESRDRRLARRSPSTRSIGAMISTQTQGNVKAEATRYVTDPDLSGFRNFSARWNSIGEGEGLRIAARANCRDDGQD